MTKYKIITLIFGIIILASCTNQDSHIDNDVETWKLGWRMIENEMSDSLDMAELQFDSLLNTSKEVNSHFVGVGLEIKFKMNKSDDIDRILNSQDNETLEKICKKEFLSTLEICFKFAEEKIENKSLQIELLKMFVDDQAARGNVMNDIILKYDLNDHQVTKDRGIITDEINRNRLKEIFKEFGFPTKKMVGTVAMQGIFLMIQHSDGDKDWQKHQLVNIEKAVKSGDMNGQSYAYLHDRIKINSGEKQLYGTQFANVDLANKIAELADTEDLENLDTRRRQYGMMPIEMYKRFMLRN